MSNLIALLIIAVICAVAGRRYDLCRVILWYYVLYIVTAPIGIVSTQFYYLLQLLLDIWVILVCCKISYFYKRLFFVPLMYAVIIFTSLVCDGLKLIDEALEYYAFNELHQLRQSYSIKLDIFFALVGSNGAISLLCSAFRRTRASITRNSASAKAKHS